MILAIETSSTNCSVALIYQGKCVAFMEENDGYTHAENLMVFIDELLQLHEVSKNDIEAIAVSKGPGSYTGLRIGVSAAKGLCMGLNVPLIAVNALHAMYFHPKVAEKITSNALFLPMLDARREEVYMTTLSAKGRVLDSTQAKVISPQSFDGLTCEQAFLFGPGADKFTQMFAHHRKVNIIEGVVPSARWLAELAQQAFDAKNFENAAYFEPFYLKEFVATTPKKVL